MNNSLALITGSLMTRSRPESARNRKLSVDIRFSTTKRGRIKLFAQNLFVHTGQQNIFSTQNTNAWSLPNPHEVENVSRYSLPKMAKPLDVRHSTPTPGDFITSHDPKRYQRYFVQKIHSVVFLVSQDVFSIVVYQQQAVSSTNLSVIASDRALFICPW